MLTFIGYGPGAITLGGGTAMLAADFDSTADRVVFNIDDEDEIFEGDLFSNEDGNDATQTGFVTDLDGNLIAGGGPVPQTIYSEERIVLTDPATGDVITLQVVEIDSNPSSTAGAGIFVGFLTDAPLVPGVVYDAVVENTFPSGFGGGPGNEALYADFVDVPCFTPGSMVATPQGARAVETLEVGDLVITRDRGLRAIRWVGERRMTGARLQALPHVRPILIRKDAIGPGVPERDIRVSPQHRVLLEGAACRLQFGVDEILVPAKALVNDDTVRVDEAGREVTYLHFLFDRHEVLWADAMLTESLHPGHMALDAFGGAARAELFALFPDLAERPENYGPTARPTVRMAEARMLARSVLRGGTRRPLTPPPGARRAGRRPVAAARSAHG
ncbi:MAG: Hint domain-containing protein [Pseudomonadota bacterium]